VGREGKVEWRMEGGDGRGLEGLDRAGEFRRRV
jgi:hypothetical protein